MKKRPAIKRGDLVKLARPLDTDEIFRVLGISASRLLRFQRRNGKDPVVLIGSDGKADVRVMNRCGKAYTYKRRQLWLIPNQPKRSKG